jgi:hypothetical protein
LDSAVHSWSRGVGCEDLDGKTKTSFDFCIRGNPAYVEKPCCTAPEYKIVMSQQLVEYSVVRYHHPENNLALQDRTFSGLLYGTNLICTRKSSFATQRDRIHTNTYAYAGFQALKSISHTSRNQTAFIRGELATAPNRVAWLRLQSEPGSQNTCMYRLCIQVHVEQTRKNFVLTRSKHGTAR